MLSNFMRICFLMLSPFLYEARAGFLDVKVMETEIDIMFENAAEPWSKADGTGYANDIVVAAFQEMGVSVKKLVVPYARCKQMALIGKIPACVSMTWLPEFKGLIELAPDPLIILNSDVFENKAKPLPRPTANQCKLPAGLVVGVVNGYEYPKETMDLKPPTKSWVTSGSDVQSLQRLALRRMDAAVVITNDLEERNQKAIAAQVEDRVRFAFNCGEQTGTIGFSLKSPRGIWARDLYREGYRRLKENGQLDKIHQKWMAKL
ncbi:MAG: hypothetical protein ACXWC9_10850 [Pseudobdellovibrionaceae bacterium]